MKSFDREVSRILCPLDSAKTERRLVLLVHVERYALAAVPVPGALIVLTRTIWVDVCHVTMNVVGR